MRAMVFSRLALLGGVLWLCLATYSAAQTQATLSEVSVTARGYEAETVQTPQAVEVIELDGQAQVGPVGDVLRGTAGVSIQSDGAWGKNPVLRGLSRESIVVMVDGIRVNSAQPQGAIASMMDVGLLERVEVVKGPGAVLYGSGALGGVINMLTPRVGFSDTPTSDGRFSLSAGTVDRGWSGAALYNFSSERHGLVVGGAWRDAGDYKSPHGREPRTGYESNTALLKYGFRLSADTALRLGVQRHEDEDVWYPGSARTGGQPGGAGLAPALGRVTIHSPKQRRELYEANVEQRIGSGLLNAGVYRQEVFRQVRAYGDSIARDYVRTQVTFATSGLRAQYLLPIADDQILTAGVEHWQMNADPERYMDNNPPQFDSNVRNDPFRRGRLKSTGLYVQDELTRGNTVYTGALRYDRVHGSADQRGSGATAQTSGLSSTDHMLSWSFGAIHEIAPLLRPYASLSRAWRAADMRERFEDSVRGDGYYRTGNPQLDPERATSIELGLKGQGNVARYQAAAFYTRIDDYIAGRVTGDIASNGLPVKRTENISRVAIYGLEGSAVIPVGRFEADAALTWLRGHNRQDDEPLHEMPPPELRLGFGENPAQGLYWRAQWRLVKRQNRIATVFTNGTEDATAGFGTVDLRAGWRFGKTGMLKTANLDVQLHNLLDKGYHEHLTQGLSGQEIGAPGRGLTLSFTGSF